jgi:hypothetical protein
LRRPLTPQALDIGPTPTVVVLIAVPSKVETKTTIVLASRTALDVVRRGRRPCRRSVHQGDCQQIAAGVIAAAIAAALFRRPWRLYAQDGDHASHKGDWQGREGPTSIVPDARNCWAPIARAICCRISGGDQSVVISRAGCQAASDGQVYRAAGRKHEGRQRR